MATEVGVIYSDWSLPWVMPSGKSSSYRIRLHYDLKEETNTEISYTIRGFVDLTHGYNTKFTGILRFGDSQVTGTSPVVTELDVPIFYYTKTFTKSENETTVLLYAEVSPEHGGWEQKTVTVSADIPIPAKWYTITFNANGGSNPPASQKKIHGTNLTLTTETPTRAGYDFVSWNTAADGSGTSYASGAAFSTNADTTLYAQWHISYVPPKVENIRAYRVANGKSGYNPDVLSSGTKIYAEFKLTNPVSGTVTVSAKFGTTASASSGTSGSIKYFYSPDSHLPATSIETVTFTLSVTDYKNNKYTYTYSTFVSKEIYIFDAFKGTSGSTEYQSFALGGNARDFSSSSRSSKGDFDCYMDASFKGSMTIATPLPIASGGTGASTVAAARNNLGLGNTSGALPVANGGTGATSLATVQENLGIKANSERIATIAADLNVQKSRIDTFTSLPEGSTSGNAELADIRVGADGTTYDTAGNAVRGQIGELKSDLSQIPTHFEYITVTQQHGKRWQYSDNFNLIDAAGYYACDFSAEENQEYTIRARNVGTNTTFAIAFFNGNTLIHSITDAPTTDNHTVVVKAPTGCNSIRFTTNNNSNPYVLVKKKALGKLDAVYVALSGSDDHTGEKSHPFQTIAKAVDSNLSDTIVVANGRYQAPISISDRKKVHLIGALDGTTVIDYTTTITPITGSSGVKEVAFSSIESDAIYKVFVSKELQISQTGNATAYTVNLWSFDGLTLMIPKETLAEVQSTENTWTYDGSKIYVNGTGSDYKLVNSYEDNGAYFSNIQELTLENINVRYSGYNNCKIENCNNIKVIGCDFSNSGRQHGMTIDNSNGTIEKCTAFRNCYDGFNIHNKGNTVFIDCESGYNRDDGLSHHDGSTGTVIGGKYHHNYKGGISPTYDAKVDIYNALCSSNGYGIYYSTVSEPTECIISGCSLVGNNAYGLRVVGYNITSIGTIYADNNSNSKADGGGSIYNLGGN